MALDTSEQQQPDVGSEGQAAPASDASALEPRDLPADPEDDFEEEEELEEPSTRRAPRRVGTNLVMTIVFGLAMFILGGFAGYVGRPVISPSPTAADPRQAMLQSVIQRTRHFKGNANAPVTIIEFSDYQ